MASGRLDIGLRRVRTRRPSIPESALAGVGPHVDFVAIDFETANASRASICSVGVAIVDGGEVVLDGSFLVDPEVEFSPYNVAVNRIDADDVRGAPTLPEVWPTLMRVLDHTRVAAHCAAFDIGVLRSSAARYGLVGPTMDVYCTWRLSKRMWPGMPSYGLGVVARSVGFEFDHHDAGQDAVACARVMLSAQKQVGALSVVDLAQRLDYSAGHLTPRSFEAADARPELVAVDGRVDADPSHPLYGRTVCFTGAMYSMVRHEAAAAVVEVGGNFRDNVSRKVDYLVIGDADFVAFADGWRTGKLERADALRLDGAPIEVISEGDFLTLLRS